MPKEKVTKVRSMDFIKSKFHRDTIRRFVNDLKGCTDSSSFHANLLNSLWDIVKWPKYKSDCYFFAPYELKLIGVHMNNHKKQQQKK